MTIIDASDLSAGWDDAIQIDASDLSADWDDAIQENVERTAYEERGFMSQEDFDAQFGAIDRERTDFYAERDQVDWY